MALDDLLLAVKISGFCILENVIPAELCPEIRRSMQEAVKRKQHEYANAPKAISFVPSVINEDQSFVSYLAEPRLMQLVEALLGEHVRISFTSAIINEPGNDRGKWHADWPFNQEAAGHVPAPYPDAVMHLTTLWMLSAFSADNGGTLVLPGSHRYPTNPTVGDQYDSYQIFPAQMNASGPIGSVLVFDSRLWHASAPNLTGEPRVAMAVRYAPWWLNTEVLRPESDERKRMVEETGAQDNQVPSINRDVYEKLPEPVKQLYRHWVAG